jgi:hypothetical protein
MRQRSNAIFPKFCLLAARLCTVNLPPSHCPRGGRGVSGFTQRGRQYIKSGTINHSPPRQYSRRGWLQCQHSLATLCARMSESSIWVIILYSSCHSTLSSHFDHYIRCIVRSTVRAPEPYFPRACPREATESPLSFHSRTSLSALSDHFPRKPRQASPFGPAPLELRDSRSLVRSIMATAWACRSTIALSTS